MATCQDCRFYKKKTENTGDCFGHEVPASMDASKCPQKAFQPAKVR